MNAADPCSDPDSNPDSDLLDSSSSSESGGLDVDYDPALSDDGASVSKLPVQHGEQGAAKHGAANQEVKPAVATKQQDKGKEGAAKQRKKLFTSGFFKREVGRAESVIGYTDYTQKQKDILTTRVKNSARRTWVRKSKTYPTSFTLGGMQSISWSGPQIVRELIQNQLDALRELARIGLPKGERPFLIV